jgi:hypothetical protein
MDGCFLIGLELNLFIQSPTLLRVFLRQLVAETM